MNTLFDDSQYIVKPRSTDGTFCTTRTKKRLTGLGRALWGKLDGVMCFGNNYDNVTKKFWLLKLNFVNLPNRINSIIYFDMTFKKHKYHAQKTNGYDSKKEARRADVLKLMLKQGIISELQEQVPFILCPKQEGKDFKGKIICLRREMKYIADFVYIEDGKTIIEDSKGFKTPEYKRKKRLMKKLFDIDIKET